VGNLIEKIKNKSVKKFGTFQGVFIPSTEAILGTVLFLLLPTLTADVGLLMMAAIIIMAHTVTISTAFSLSDCATNLNTIGGGGMYALSRRSLGKAFGGSIGIMLYFAQASSIAFYCIGFAEPLQRILSPLLMPFIDNISGFYIPKDIILFQKQLIAGAMFFIFFIIAMIGADFTLKIQFLILIILAGSIITIFISPLLGIKFHSENIFYESINKINLLGNRQWGTKLPVIVAIFFLTFTQFFPAVTGIDAGVGMSGDLKDPKKSLVKGTFLSISITFVVYLISAFIFSLIKKDVILHGAESYDFKQHILGIPQGENLTALLGLSNNIIKDISTGFLKSIPGLMILLGILFATSSSALSCFMTAPRTAQSLARDRVLPKFLCFLGYDFKKRGTEPRFATLVTFFISLIVIIIGNINIAAIIVGICFLVVYGWMNGSAFFERISHNPTFRPTIKNHWIVSLYGLMASLIAICLFSWVIGILIIISQLIIFWLILKFKTENKLEGVWWGVLFTFVTNSLRSLRKIVQGTKNWRPIVSVVSFSDNIVETRNLAHLGERIAANQGLVYMNILHTPRSKFLTEDFKYNIPTHDIFLANGDLTQAILSLIQASHPGDIIANSILMEYKKNVSSLDIVARALSLGKNIFVLKNGEKLTDYSMIDIWWRGEKNGNLMVLLAYIINNYNREQFKKKDCKIRIIRKLGKNDDENQAYEELNTLLLKGRLSGEVIILPNDTRSVSDTINDFSHTADLVMVGMPGNLRSEGLSKIFKINERFFDKEIHKYDNMPAMLFVKSATLINLIEDSTM